MRTFFGIVFVILSLGVGGFQIGLALGQPWGHLAMGGAFEGVFPPEIRIAAAVQAALFVLMAGHMARGAGLWVRPFGLFGKLGKAFGYVIVALMGVSVVLNAITPSAQERLLWLPVALGLFLSALMIMLKAPKRLDDH